MSTIFVSVEEACPPGQQRQDASTDDPIAAGNEDVAENHGIKGRLRLLAKRMRPWLLSPTPGNTPQQITRAIFLLTVAGGIVAAFVYGFPQLVSLQTAFLFLVTSSTEKRHESEIPFSLFTCN